MCATPKPGSSAATGSLSTTLVQPFIDGCDEDGRLVADRELVVPRGHCAVSFQAIDAALDHVSRLVVLGVELRRTAAERAALLAVAGLVSLVRDGAADAAPPQVGAVLPGGVRLAAVMLLPANFDTSNFGYDRAVSVPASYVPDFSSSE